MIDLKCHPSSPSRSVRAIQASARRLPNGELNLSFRLEGDLARMLVPAPGAARIGRELWRHTCFEAFIAAEGQPTYHELNFAPSSEWSVYAFSAYRMGSQVEDERMAPRISVRAAADQLELDALVRLETLSEKYPRAPLRVGLSAVIEAQEGISYWALRHPGQKPDFHDRDGFALLLAPPGS